MEDPIAVLVWKRWIRQGKARLLETQGVGKKILEKTHYTDESKHPILGLSEIKSIIFCKLVNVCQYSQ